MTDWITDELEQDETSASVGFLDWLASVTESINQTMHYQLPGTPQPLTFQAPQFFFECLQQRISAGARKRRLPNLPKAYLRTELPPFGQFTKYTWQITNLAHVQQIFETPSVS